MLVEGFVNCYTGVIFFQQARNGLCHEPVACCVHHLVLGLSPGKQNVKFKPL